MRVLASPDSLTSDLSSTGRGVGVVTVQGLNVMSATQYKSVKSLLAVLGFGLALGASSIVFAQTLSESIRIDAATYQRVVEENLDLRKEQARVEGEISALRRKNANLLLDIQDLERKRDQLTALVAQLKTPDELAAQMARLNSEKVVLVREIDRLRESLASVAATAPLTNSPPVAVAPGPGSDLFRKLERENADLRLDLAKARATGMNEAVAKGIVQKSEMVLKTEVAKLDAQYQTVAAELEALKRREGSLKKAVEMQAKKTFEAEKALNEARLEGARKDEEVESAKQQAKAAQVALKKLELQSPPQVAQVLQPHASDASVSTLLTAGQKCLAAGRLRETEKLYLAAFRKEPKNVIISYNLGVLYGDYLKDYAKAAKYYRNYLALAPKAADADQVRSWLIDMNAKSKW